MGVAWDSTSSESALVESGQTHMQLLLHCSFRIDKETLILFCLIFLSHYIGGFFSLIFLSVLSTGNIYP